MEANFSQFDGQTVLVTGGTGSFGQKFVRHMLERSKVKKLIIFSRDELKQSEMMAAISDPHDCLRFFLGDVREVQRLQRALNGVDIVIHAAALKQVPLLEYNPYEAVKTNIIGTQNIIDAAINMHVKKVIFISTDKAVNPVNLYGATKMCAEKLMIHGNVYAGGTTKFSAVRYGNVIGSRGSIIETIKKRAPDDPVRLTHPDMTRFWITLEQGVALVTKAAALMSGGEIFVPKLPSMRIVDLIAAIAPGALQEVIGIRPGEKINEVLLTEEENRRTSEYEDFYVVYPTEMARSLSAMTGGQSLPPDFEYTSHRNSRQLTPEDIRGFISV